MASENNFRIAGALGIDPNPPEPAEQEVLTQGIGFPLRPISSVPPLDLELPEEMVALGIPMQWMGLWEEGKIYPAGSYVRDNVYAAVANVATVDKPSPIPTGNPEFSQPAFTPLTVLVAGAATTGQEYEFGPTGNGWINTIRAWVPTVGGGVQHRVKVQNTTDPIRPRTIYQTEFIGVSGMWVTVANLYIPIITGQKIAVTLETLSSLSENTVSHPWRYRGEGTGVPASGEWLSNSDNTQIRVSKTDLDGVNQAADLLAAGIGSTFTFTDQIDNPRTVTYRVEQQTDETDHVTYDVTVTAITQMPIVGNACFCNIKIVTLADASVSEQAAVWPAGNPTWATVTGIKKSNGTDVPGFTGYGFGVDLQFEPAIWSADWTLVSAAPV